MKPQLVHTNLNHHDFYFLKDDKYIGQRIALGKYEPYLTSLMLAQIKPTDTVVDAGANIGYDTILFASVAKKVYAFEPDPINFQILLKNIVSGGLKNIIAVNSALSDANTSKYLYQSSENHGDHRLFAFAKASTKFKTKLVKLDTYLHAKVDFIKIDTQGWEPAVIAGAKNLITTYHPTIFFEYWPSAYKQAKLNHRHMLAFLKKEYDNLYFIDEYIQIYYPASRSHIDNYCRRSKGQTCNLVVSKNHNFKFTIGQFKNFWPKKFIKRLLGFPLT